MQSLNIKKKNFLIHLISILIFSNFIFGQQIRIGILGENQLINYTSLIVTVIILIFYNKRFDKKYKFLMLIFFTYMFITIPFYSISLKGSLLNLFVIVMPISLIGLRLTLYEFKIIFKLFLKLITLITIFITIIGILDYMTNYYFMQEISNYLSPRLQELLAIEIESPIFRMYSYLGHPLLNVEIYLIYYIFNFINIKYIEKKGNLIIKSVVAGIGIGLTASKSGLVLFILVLVLTNMNKIKKVDAIIIAIMLAIMKYIGIFNTTIARLSSGNLSTGRNEMWEVIKSLKLYPIKNFIGYGRGFVFKYNEVIHKASAAFEYPIRLFALELGRVTTILIYICIFVYPFLYFIKNKNYMLLSLFVVIFLQVNTFNGLGLNGDYLYIFSIVIVLILNTSDYINERRKI